MAEISGDTTMVTLRGCLVSVSQSRWNQWMLDAIPHETKLCLKSLIADDHKMISGALSEFLTKSGDFEVFSTHSRESARTTLEECPDIDLALLHLKMAGMEDIVCLMENAKDTKIVMRSICKKISNKNRVHAVILGHDLV